MPKLIWGSPRTPSYEAKVDRGVFYPKHSIGYAWTGLISVNEHLLDRGFSAEILAVTYPIEFEAFDGYAKTQLGKPREVFDLTYRMIQPDGSYNIHIIYNAMVNPTTWNNSTNDVEQIIFTWDLHATPELVPDARSSSHFIINSLLVNTGVFDIIESQLYGTDSTFSRMPTIIELLDISIN